MSVHAADIRPETILNHHYTVQSKNQFYIALIKIKTLFLLNIPNEVSKPIGSI